MKDKLEEEFKKFNYKLEDLSWAEDLPDVTIEKSKMIGTNPKVSVIIANYNNSPYLERMMKSLVEQTIGIENLQILFVDDRSTDDSLDKIRPFLESYPNIEIYLLNKNTGGAHGPRNVGLLHAQGEYIVILDADDWYAKDGLELLYKTLEHSGDGMAFGGVVRSKNGELELMTRAYNEQERTKVPLTELPYEFYTWLGPQGNMIRHSLIKENNLHFIKQRVADDVSFFYQALLFSKTISQILQITTYVNRDDDNISLSKNINENFLTSWLRAIAYLSSSYPNNEVLKKFITKRLEWILVDFTMRWDTSFGLSRTSIEKLRVLMERYLSDLTFDPSPYFTIDVYRYIWQYLQEADDEKLLRFVSWHTLPIIDKSLQKIENLYYFIPEEDDLPQINYPILKGKTIKVDESGIYLQFDNHVPEVLDYIELRNNTALNNIFRKKAVHLSNTTYELQLSREEFDSLSSGLHRLYAVLRNQIEYQIAIDKLQPYCAAGALLSENSGVINLYKPISKQQQVLAFKALPNKYLGQWIHINSQLNTEGEFEFVLPDGEKISKRNYQNSIIVFPKINPRLAKDLSIKAGIYRLTKEMKTYQKDNLSQMTIKSGTLITVSHCFFSETGEMILVTSAGQIIFDKTALLPVEKPVEVIMLKNIYSYDSPNFSKESKKKHYLKGSTIKVDKLVFNKNYRVRFMTTDQKYITENPAFVSFAENIGAKAIKKQSLWQAARQKRSRHGKAI